MIQLRIAAVSRRGGTSKRVFLLASDLPANRHARDRLLRAVRPFAISAGLVAAPADGVAT